MVYNPLRKCSAFTRLLRPYDTGLNCDFHSLIDFRKSKDPQLDLIWFKKAVRLYNLFLKIAMTI